MKNRLEKILNNSILIIIKNGFICISGLTIVSSFFTLIANFPIVSVNNFFKAHLGDIWTVLIPKMSNAFYFFISIYILISIGYQASKYFGIPRIISTLTTLMAYLIFLPIKKIDNVYYLSINNLNSNDIFLSMILGILIPLMLKFIYKMDITIKMPKDVPKDVSISFESIIPTMIVLLICFICNLCLYLSGINYLPDLIYDLIQIPILRLGNNIFSIIIMNIGIALLWFIGFNGTYIFNTVMTPILATLSIENLTALSNGLAPPNIITSTFQAIYTNLGGCGSTLALVIGMLLCKNNSLKKIAKISIIPSIFNINETIVYGLPIVMNPILFFPFVICPFINALISYCSMYFGIVNYTNGIQLPWTVPIFISGFLASGLSGLMLQVFLLIINIIIYMPFIKRVEREFKK